MQNDNDALGTTSGTPPLILTGENTPICFSHDSISAPGCPSVLAHLEKHNKGTYDRDMAIRILQVSGCRACEILRLTWADVMDNDLVLVRTAKRGTATTVIIPGCSLLSQRVPPSSRCFPLFRCTYHQLYNRMLRLGLVMDSSGKIKRAVTHSPRHIMAQAVAAIAGPIAASQVLNQKSPSSIGYYLPPIVVPVVTWHCHEASGYAWVYCTIDTTGFHCWTYKYVVVTAAYPIGYNNKGGSIPSNPRDVDPCDTTPLNWQHGMTLGLSNGKVYPIQVTMRLWCGKSEYDYSAAVNFADV